MRGKQEFSIRNEFLTATISSLGGELISLCDARGKEYLWQRDPAFWRDTSPNLFPYIGQLTDGTYTYRGKEYHMKIHGFLEYMETEMVSQEENKITFRLTSSEETLAQYPFRFVFEVQYTLEGESLEMRYRVINCDIETMYFGVGGHTGFQVPLEKDQCFEDYMIDFGQEADIISIGLTDSVFVTGEDILYPLRDNRYIDLRHDIFARRCQVLKNTSGKCVLRSRKGGVAVEVEYPDMEYLALWHTVGKAAPYICIEPWSSLPSRNEVVEDLETQESLLSLEAGKTYENAILFRIIK